MSVLAVTAPFQSDLPTVDQRVLDVRSIRVWFDKLKAVNGVSFTLSRGHLLGLIGPNGAGKTTLLRSICGLQSVTAGSVHILGQEMRPGNLELLAHVGFTSDTPPAYESLTVRQFLRFVGKGYDLSIAEADDRMDFWLEKVWLKEKAGSKIKSLSRGMRQRVGIARTLLPNPTIVVLDEPAAGLDPAGRVQFRQLLCDLREQGKALIVSSHILADMADYCTHAGIMSAGRLIKFGTVRSVIDSQTGDRCRYTVGFSKSVAGLDKSLADIDGVSNIVADRERVILEYPSDRDAAVVLLAELVRRKLPVSSFSANAVDLEEAYLRAGVIQVD